MQPSQQSQSTLKSTFLDCHNSTEDVRNFISKLFLEKGEIFGVYENYDADIIEEGNTGLFQEFFSNENLTTELKSQLFCDLPASPIEIKSSDQLLHPGSSHTKNCEENKENVFTELKALEEITIGIIGYYENDGTRNIEDELMNTKFKKKKENLTELNSLLCSDSPTMSIEIETFDKPQQGSDIENQLLHPGNLCDNSDVKPPIICKICNKQFSLSQNLIKHMLIHNGIKAFCCEMCDKSFTQKVHLQNHIRCHTGEKPQVCEICKKTFSQLSTLRNHLKVHTNERPYTCEICRKTFFDSQNLKKHVVKHSIIKPYNCKICNQSFSTLSGLKTHTTIHTGEKPFICIVCKKSFRRFNIFKRHSSLHERLV